MVTENIQSSRKAYNCRLCGGALGSVALSLGNQPISNRLPRNIEVSNRYPLDVALCEQCGLVQLGHHIDAKEHFHDDYTYISGASNTWINHCEEYADDISTKYNVEPGELVVEVGSNDGTLLNALQKRNHRVLGVEPSGNVADIANTKGAPTISAFFNHDSATHIRSEYGAAKMVVGNNVLAHVPDTDSFLKAASYLIADDGILCFEFPHFVNIIQKMYFDTIYHEHYTYLGVGPLDCWAKQNDMTIVGIDEQPTHGGTLRVLMKRGRNHSVPAKIAEMISYEAQFQNHQAWIELSGRLERWRVQFQQLVREKLASGKKIVGYAAASKATVLVNYLNLTSNEIAYCCDASALKQDRFIPGANIPVVSPDRLKLDRPDIIIVFAWNIFEELRTTIGRYISSPVEMINPLPHIELLRIFPEIE